MASIYGMATEQTKEQIFSKTNWGDVAIDLTAFVLRHITYFGKVNYKDLNLPKGYRAQDIAQDAIEDVYTGKRAWDHVKYPDLVKFLKYSVCRSKLYNLYTSAEYRSLVKVGTLLYDDADENEQQHGYGIEGLAPVNDNIEEAIDTKQMIDRLKYALRPNETESMVFLMMLEGHTTEVITASLNLSTGEVNNSKKRIKRKFKEIRAA